MSTTDVNDYAVQFMALMQEAEDSDESELEDVVHALNAIYEESGHVLTDGKSPTAERQMIIFLYMLWDTYGSFLTNNYERFPTLFADMFSMFDEGGLESLVDMVKTLLTEWEKENIRLLRKEILSHDAEIFLILPADSGGTLRVPRDRKSGDLSYDEMVEDHLIIAGIYEAMLICRYEKDSKVSYALYRFRTSESGYGLIQAVKAPESGDICIHGFDTGEVEVIDQEHTEFKLLPFRLDAVLPC